MSRGQTHVQDTSNCPVNHSQQTIAHRPADTYQTLGVHPRPGQCCLVICDAEPTLIKRLMNYSRLLGCCGYPVNRVKHIEGTHLRDFNSDKKV